jgi:hypothetical protein
VTRHHRDSEDDILDMLATNEEDFFDKLTERQIREALRYFSNGIVLI